MKRAALSMSVALVMFLTVISPFPQAAAAADLDGWVHQVSGVTHNLVDVHALDEQTAWAVGWNGTILKTTNGGTTWNPQNSDTGNDLQDIYAVDSSTAWVVGHSSTVRVTTDGGDNWNTPTEPSPTVNLAGVHAFSDEKAWVVGGGGTVLWTDTGGTSWTTQTSNTTEDLFAISAADENNAWAVGNEGALIHTANGGTTWTPQTATDEKLRGVHALSPDVAWICGFEGEVWKTYDGGDTWHEQGTPTDQILYDIWAVDNNVAWTVGYDDFELDEGIILKTSADGNDWHYQYGATKNLLGVSAANDMVAWAVGKDGEILKTTNGGEWYRTWYLAEGATLGGFETWIVVQNPTTQTANVDITYMTDKGPVQGPVFPLPRESRESVNVADTVQSYKVSTYVSSDHPVVAERAMYWGGRRAGHDSIGTVAPAMTWYLAEGATLGGFETWVTVQNPGAEAAHVDLTYMTDKGEVDGPTVTVGAQSRESVNVADTTQTWKVSTMLTSDRPVVAERSMYWNGRTGGHESIGVNGPDTTWYLAEGATVAGFETWVVLQNPGDETAHVDLTYMTDKGQVEGPTVDVGSKSRESVFVADTVQSWKVSTKVTSDVPVIAERAMYWGNRVEGHDSIGTTMPQDTWYLAEGATLGGFETWIVVQNPGGIDSSVTLTYMTDQGEVKGPTFTLEAHSRESVFVADTVQSWKVSTMVTSSSPVIAERAVYWGNRTGGHESIGLGL